MESHPSSFGDPIVALLLGFACSLTLNPQNFDYELRSPLRMTYSGIVRGFSFKINDFWSPVFLLINFLNEQGLGGACELAIAKASGALAPTVRPKTNKLISIFVV